MDCERKRRCSLRRPRQLFIPILRRPSVRPTITMTAPPPPAPPPYLWSCECVPYDGPYNCSGVQNMRAALTCNGNVAKRWEHLGDCIHATGCRDGGSGCDVVWDDPLRYKWASLVSQYSHGLCNADPPEPPSPPPGRRGVGANNYRPHTAGRPINSTRSRIHSRRFLALCSASMR